MNLIPSIVPILHFPRPGGWSDVLKARLRAPDIDPLVARKVLEQYPLNTPVHLSNLPNTHRNHNMIVKTGQGKKIIKRYRDDWQPDTIRFEHSLLKRLAQTGFPAPHLVPATGGRTCVALDGQYFCLFDFIAGRNYSSSFLVRPQRVRMMSTAGQVLARLHCQLPGYLPAGQHHLGFPDYAHPRHRDLKWHAEKLDELVLRSKTLQDEDCKTSARWLTGQSSAVLAEMGRLEELLNAAHLPRVIIHGDYGLHNLIFQNVNCAVAVDYELARIEWRLSDLVSVISKFRYKSGRYDLESITHFLKAYQRVFPIRPGEWHLLPHVWKFYKLMKAIQYWGSFFETNGPVRKLRSARDEIEQSGWGFENPGVLAELWRSTI